jgi:dTDP-4-amino-4,6-dideoxygalactose transaminase
LQVHSHSYHLFALLTGQRDKLSAYLTQAGVANLAHYPIPVHKQTSCADVRTDPAGLQAAERHAEHCLSIPCHPQMTDEDVKQVIEAINAYG